MEYILFDLQFFPPAQGRYSVAVNCPLLQGDAVGEFVSPAADPDKPVLVPGEPERLSKAQRGRDGIPIDATTWKQIGNCAKALGLGVPEFPSVAD